MGGYISRFCPVAHDKRVESSWLQRERRKIIKPAQNVGNAGGDFVFRVPGFAGFQILVVKDAFVPGIVECKLRLPPVRSFCNVLGNVERTEGARIEAGFKKIMDFVQSVHYAT